MKTEIFVNPHFSHLGAFVKQIPDGYSYMGEEIHNGRNEVRKANLLNLHFTIKYFKKITLTNRLIFATIRKSKARRAYEHSKLLIQKGITSPEPIAYINCYRFGLLYKSFYISLFTSYKPLKELLNLPISVSEEGLKAFARFTFRLQNAGILHDDYTIDNVLYDKIGNRYDFSLIDNNRMRFRKYSYARGLKNLERLKVPVDKMGIIASEYARESNESDLRTLNAMVFFRVRHIIIRSVRKCLKYSLSVVKINSK